MSGLWVSPFFSYFGCFSALRLHVSIVQLASAVNVLVCYNERTTYCSMVQVPKEEVKTL